MVKKCDKGKHYFDDSRFLICPFCEKVKKNSEQQKQDAKDMENTLPTVTLEETLTYDE